MLSGNLSRLIIDLGPGDKNAPLWLLPQARNGPSTQRGLVSPAPDSGRSNESLELGCYRLGRRRLKLMDEIHIELDRTEIRRLLPAPDDLAVRSEIWFCDGSSPYRLTLFDMSRNAFWH